MAVKFLPEDHKYVSVDPAENISWMSVTSLISKLKQPFEAEKIAEKSSKNKRSKWYGMTKDQILSVWKAESERAITVGNWYHNQREEDLLGLDSIERHGKVIPIMQPQADTSGLKVAPDQRLTDGMYPEHFVYMKSLGICGQSDLVEVIDGVVHITDYKTNKEIRSESYKDWEGLSQKMNHPVSHLDDCNLNHYNLQLSIYMYMILKHNPKLKPGTLMIQHIMFEDEGKDPNGYPILKTNTDGDPVIKDIIYYDIPYLKDEVLALVKWFQDNKSKFK
jgi:ATP-dependent exoDNAse (exonuclease V) beta subunit